MPLYAAVKQTRRATVELDGLAKGETERIDKLGAKLESGGLVVEVQAGHRRKRIDNKVGIVAEHGPGDALGDGGIENLAHASCRKV